MGFIVGAVLCPTHLVLNPAIIALEEEFLPCVPFGEHRNGIPDSRVP